MTAASLYTAYTMFGDDPFVVASPGAEDVSFSAWDYAKQRCTESVRSLCKAKARHADLCANSRHLRH
jgi:hypothetical protein